MKSGTNNMVLKTFSFLDKEAEDFVRFNGEVVKVKAINHRHAEQLFLDNGIVDDCDNWTNTATVTWCWEDMERGFNS